jgi:exopolysaccharide biosynthesis polyprenyl glycosylphosphotransferase
MRRALVAADLISLTTAFALAEWMFVGGTAEVDIVSREVEVFLFVVTLPAWVLLARIFGLYAHDEERADHRTFDDTGRVIVVATMGAWSLLALSWLTSAAHPYVPKLLTFWVAAVVLVPTARALARKRVRRSSAYIQNTVIVGAGEIGQLVGSKVRRHPEYGINLLGFVDQEPTHRRDDLGDLSLLGSIGELPLIVHELDVDRVIVAFGGDDPPRLMTDLRLLRHSGVQVDVVPRLFDIVGPGAQVHTLEGVPLVGLPPVRLPPGSRALKRSLDLFGSLVGLALLAPLFAYIAIRIKLDSPGPFFFKQQRPGRDGVLFDVVKFRTMHVAGPGVDSAPPLQGALANEYSRKHKLDDDPRVTKVGRWLRRTSLDELPQLWNVVRGEMSLVGPRPMLIEELERPRAVTDELLSVKPGMTGYWQVNGRSDTDYDDRLRLELSYVASWSIGLDLTILARTVRVLMSGAGAP